ncbi:MAG: 50S ribosomal protein L2 [Rickettsiales bacterium]|nr:50S ribosomal protein L2 [Rickettsiales bacterium]
MALKKFNPTTPSQRGLVLIDRSELYKGKPEKSLVKGKTKTGGRNNMGRITTRHIGGGHKQKYRMVDFKRTKTGAAIVERIEYDPNRTAFIALIKYDDATISYIIAPQRLSVGDKVESGEKVEVKPGNTMPLKNIPVGTIIHNIEMKPKKGAQIARSAGGYAQLVGKDAGYAQVKLRSGELRLILGECLATIGAISNSDHQNQNFGKAGRSRWKGIRPTVRGVAMNPVDHPHGGGEGKTSGGRHPVTPWGKPTKGAKTRSKKKVNKLVLRTRHQAKKRKG